MSSEGTPTFQDVTLHFVSIPAINIEPQEQQQFDKEEIINALQEELQSTQEELQQKEFEIQQLIEELQKYNQSEYEQEIQSMKNSHSRKVDRYETQISDLENCVQNEKNQSKKYYEALENLEIENENLRAEVKKLSKQISAITDQHEKLENIQQQLNSLAGSKSNTNATNSPKSMNNLNNKSSFNEHVLNFNQAAHAHAQNMNKSQNQVDSGMFLNVPPQRTGGAHRKQTSCFDLPHTTGDDVDNWLDQKNQEQQKEFFSYEDSWFSKIEILKEKYVHEQGRNKDLEFIINSQKQTLQLTSDQIQKLDSYRKEQEEKLSQLQAQLESVDKLRAHERSKIDCVITFCHLINEFSFTNLEILGKLSQLPQILAAFLKDEIDDLSFETRHLFSPTTLVKSAKQQQDNMQIIEDITNDTNTNVDDRTIPEDRTKNIQTFFTDIKAIKAAVERIDDSFAVRRSSFNGRTDFQTLRNIEEEGTISFRNLQSQEQSAQQEKTQTPLLKMNKVPMFEEAIQTEPPSSDRKISQKMDLNQQYQNKSLFLRKAIRNCHSLVWHLPTPKKSNKK